MKDDDLILYLYDELDARERRAFERRLAADAGLAARLEALRQDFAALKALPFANAPDDMVQRWHDSLDRAADSEYRQAPAARGSFSLSSFGWGAAVAASLALGIGIGVYLSGDSGMAPTVEEIVASVPHSTRLPADSAFARGLQVHLRDTQQELAAVPVDGAADRAELVMRIIQQNRLFERAAIDNDSDKLARVLRAFEPILLRLAADDIAPEDAEDLRRQLAFELRVMLTILERDASKEVTST